jgi:flagellar basal body-associated protein FliL
MSNGTPGLDPALLNTLKEHIADARKDILNLVQTKTAEVIKANESVMLETIAKEISETINANQKVIIATAGGNPESKKEEKESKRWKIFMALLPIVLTAILGYLVWTVQTNVQKQISDNNESLKTELSLKAEFYKKKFETYEKTHALMFQLTDALAGSYHNVQDKKDASQYLGKLYEDYTRNNLYMSNEVVSELEKLFDLAGDIPTLRPTGTADLGQILDQTSKVETKMREDLHVQQIGSISDIFKRNQDK